MPIINRLLRFARNFRRDYLVLGNFLKSWPALFFSLSAVIFIGYQAAKITAKERVIKLEIAAMEARINKIKEENALAEKKLSEIDSGEMIERIAKEELNMRNAGELVAVIAERQDNATPTPIRQKTSFWERIKSIFSGILF